MLFIFNFDNKTVLDKILEKFPKSKQVDIAVGYIDITGLVKIKAAVEELIKRGGRFRLFAGMHGTKGSLSFDELKILWTINNYGRKPDEEERVKLAGSKSYHGKLYIFYDDSRYTLLIGSSNLSAPGIKFRREANVVIEGNKKDENYSQCSKAFERLWSDSLTLSGQAITVISLPKVPTSVEVDEARPIVDIEDPIIEKAKETTPIIFTITQNNLDEGGRPRINEAYLNANKEANNFFGGRNHIFEAITDDRFTFQSAISGYGADPAYGKNLRSTPSNKELGTWLKQRKNAKPGDQVYAYKIPNKENFFLFEFKPAS